MLFTLSAIRTISPYTLARRWREATGAKADLICQETMGSTKMSTKSFFVVENDIIIKNNT